MLIREIHIDNVKLFRDFRLSFVHDGKPRKWTVFVGENGLCKTSLLQAIALAASGRDRANQLANVPSLPDRRSPARDATIKALFGFSKEHHAQRSYPGMPSGPEFDATEPPGISTELSIPSGQKIFRGGSSYVDAAGNPHPALRGVPDPLEEARASELGLWFVTGFGVFRTLPSPMTAKVPEDRYLHRLSSLFEPRAMVATGYADLLAPDNAREYARALREALVDHELLPDVVDLELRGRGGVKHSSDIIDAHRFVLRAGGSTVKLPATWLSHGYQGMIAWIADLIGQVFLEAGEPVPLTSMEGLVLVDELDLNLHPAWQAELVPKLRRVFPLMQFVVTTHSPMLLPGFEKHEIFRLTRDEDGDVRVDPHHPSPALMTGSEIYERFFGIDRLYPTDLGEAVRRYGYLANDPDRTDEEDREVQALSAKLGAAEIEPGWEPVPRRRGGEGAAGGGGAPVA